MKSILLFNLIVAINFTSATPVSLLEKRRFGQENPAVLNSVRALGRLPGVPPNGRFDQIAGGFISTLLAATNACDRYALIDEVVSLSKQSGNGTQGIAVAQDLAALEKNFSPFAGNLAKPAFCTNAALPASPEVRCIVPVIDPGFKGAAEFNTKAQARLQQVKSGQLKAQECAGQSVAQQAVALGLIDCVGCNDVAVGVNAGGSVAVGNGKQEGNNNNQKKNNNIQGAGNNSNKGENFNKFTGALGAPPIRVQNVGGARPFQVILANGQLNGDFLNLGAAIGRACDIQHNNCAAVANSAQGKQQGISLAACDNQGNQCRAANPR